MQRRAFTILIVEKTHFALAIETEGYMYNFIESPSPLLTILFRLLSIVHTFECEL